MPSAYVKTIEDLIFYEYARLINKAAKMAPNNFAFRTSIWKKLKSGEIKMSASIREWEIERESRGDCIYCGSKEKVQTEHIIPKSKGGPDTSDNLVDSCQACNLKKSNKDVFEFCAMLEMDVPRLVKGKILKLVYLKHKEEGTLQESDIDGDGELNLLDLCAIFAKKTDMKNNNKQLNKMPNSVRKIDDLSLDELKNHIFLFLDKFCGYAALHNPQDDPDKFLMNIVGIRKILNSKNGTYADTHELITEMCIYINSFYDETLLKKSLSFLKPLFKKLPMKEDIYIFIEKKHSKMKDLGLSNEIIRNRPIRDRADVEAVLQLHIGETEDMQYTLKEIFSKKNTASNISIEDILSVNQKIRKGKKFVTDVTAIRNCASHHDYEIIADKIIFDSQEVDYNYHQEFTFKEFEKFMGLKGQLYALLFDMLQFYYTVDLIKTYFRRQKEN